MGAISHVLVIGLIFSPPFLTPLLIPLLLLLSPI